MLVFSSKTKTLTNKKGTFDQRTMFSQRIAGFDKGGNFETFIAADKSAPLKKLTTFTIPQDALLSGFLTNDNAENQQVEQGLPEEFFFVPTLGLYYSTGGEAKPALVMAGSRGRLAALRCNSPGLRPMTRMCRRPSARISAPRPSERRPARSRPISRRGLQRASPWCSKTSSPARGAAIRGVSRPSRIRIRRTATSTSWPTMAMELPVCMRARSMPPIPGRRSSQQGNFLSGLTGATDLVSASGDLLLIKNE